MDNLNDYLETLSELLLAVLGNVRGHVDADLVKQSRDANGEAVALQKTMKRAIYLQKLLVHSYLFTFESLSSFLGSTPSWSMRSTSDMVGARMRVV